MDLFIFSLRYIQFFFVDLIDSFQPTLSQLEILPQEFFFPHRHFACKREITNKVSKFMSVKCYEEYYFYSLILTISNSNDPNLKVIGKFVSFDFSVSIHVSIQLCDWELAILTQAGRTVSGWIPDSFLF